MSLALTNLSGFATRRRGSAVPANVVVLLHGNGTNGSTTFTDSSSYARSFTANGNAQISTAQSKFGGTSMNIDSSVATLSNSIYAADAAELSFGSNNFGIAVQCYWSSVYAGNWCPVFASKRSVAGNYEYSFYYIDNTLGLTVSANGTNISNLTVAWTPSTGQFYHIEVNRIGTAIRFFVNGTQVGSDQAIGGTIFSGTSAFYAFTDGANVSRFSGYMDELIVVNGDYLHSADFTAPSAPYYGG